MKDYSQFFEEETMLEFFFVFIFFSRLFGDVTYGIKATGLNPVSFWEHLVLLEQTEVITTLAK